MQQPHEVNEAGKRELVAGRALLILSVKPVTQAKQIIYQQVCAEIRSPGGVAQLLPTLLTSCIAKRLVQPRLQIRVHWCFQRILPDVREILFKLRFLWCQYILKHLLLRLFLRITSQCNYKGTKLEYPSPSSPNPLFTLPASSHISLHFRQILITATQRELDNFVQMQPEHHQ